MTLFLKFEVCSNWYEVSRHEFRINGTETELILFLIKTHVFGVPTIHTAVINNFYLSLMYPGFLNLSYLCYMWFFVNGRHITAEADLT